MRLDTNFPEYLRASLIYKFFSAGILLLGLAISAFTLLSMFATPVFAKDLYIKGKINGAFNPQANTVVIDYDNNGVAGKDSASTSSDGSYLVKIADGAADDPIAGFDFSQNYPNPFNGNTTIDFKLPEAARVNVVAYNILGQEVAQVFNREFAAGNHAVTFNPHNLAGYPLGDGVYWLVAQAGDHREIIKSLLLSDVKSIDGPSTSLKTDILQRDPAHLTGFYAYGPDLARSSLDLNQKPTSDQQDLGTYNVNPAKTSTGFRINIKDASGKSLDGTLETRVTRGGIERKIPSVLSSGVSEFVDHVDLDRDYPPNATMVVEDITLTSPNGSIVFPINQQANSPTVNLDLQTPLAMMSQINFAVNSNLNYAAALSW